MKSIAVIYASEGTGHRTAAEALAAHFKLACPDGNVLCRDILDYTPLILHRTVSDGYLFMARHTPWAWGWFYRSSDKQSLQASCFDKIHDILCSLYLPKLEKELYECGAEAVFFTHYFAAAVTARRNLGRFPVFYVNTDFVCHRFQRDKIYKESFVASPIAVKQHHDEGIYNVADTGIPIAPKYMNLPSKEEARRKLNFAPSDKIVLIGGGGIGAGSVPEAADSLSRREDITSVVICGNNKRLFNALSRRYRGCANMRIEGFVPNMEEFYAASDIGIMKPGGLSLSEALAAHLPLLLMDPIPGQEQLNMDYICGNGAALPLKEPKDAAEEVGALLENSEKLRAMLVNAETLSRANAAKNILKEALHL